jgi:hypothetical protein
MVKQNDSQRPKIHKPHGCLLSKKEQDFHDWTAHLSNSHSSIDYPWWRTVGHAAFP